MDGKRLMMALALLFAVTTGVSAQGWLSKLKDKAKEKIQNKVEDAVDKGMDNVLNKAEEEATGAVKGKKGKKSKDEAVVAADDNPSAATSTDFKRGSVILFQDDFQGETLGEFPSKWDLIAGNAEVRSLGGVKAVEITNNGIITPLIREPGAYLPEEFTIEYDFYYWNQKQDVGLNDIKLVLANTTDRNASPMGTDEHAFAFSHVVCDGTDHSYEYNNGSAAGLKTEGLEHAFKQGWRHVALSFNKRALKVYVDGKRIINLPRVQQPTWMCFQVPFEYENLTFIRNVVIAKGAVALYDRNEQSMTAVEKAINETGKFVTNNILFKTGKADLLPESTAEIQKVADYMKKNPTARFEVQGHTDSQGSDAVNDPLSQKRAEAVVRALASLGVDDFNLKAVGKGSHEPVADNKTEAGRAQNRRVVFVKK